MQGSTMHFIEGEKRCHMHDFAVDGATMSIPVASAAAAMAATLE